MPQNIYDDPEFFANYSQLRRQVEGLEGAPEWPTLRSMLPKTIAGSEVVDLGCGFGWFARWAASQGAAHVYAHDLSARMLAQARTMTADAAVEYYQGDLDQLELAGESYDLVYSSLTFHYVENLDRLMSTIAAGLEHNGSLVFSVEHPIYSAPAQQDFVDLDDGQRVWPLADYLQESERSPDWLGTDVKKHHRTVASYLNAVINAGLTIGRVEEFGLSNNPDDVHRPWFLLVSADKV